MIKPFPPQTRNVAAAFILRDLYARSAGIMQVQIVATAPAYPMAFKKPNGNKIDIISGGRKVTAHDFVRPILQLSNLKKSAK